MYVKFEEKNYLIFFLQYNNFEGRLMGVFGLSLEYDVVLNAMNSSDIYIRKILNNKKRGNV